MCVGPQGQAVGAISTSGREGNGEGAVSRAQAVGQVERPAWQALWPEQEDVAAPQWPSEGLTLLRPPSFLPGPPLGHTLLGAEGENDAPSRGREAASRGSEQRGEEWGVDLGATKGKTHKSGSQPTPTPGQTQSSF